MIFFTLEVRLVNNLLLWLISLSVLFSKNCFTFYKVQMKGERGLSLHEREDGKVRSLGDNFLCAHFQLRGEVTDVLDPAFQTALHAANLILTENTWLHPGDGHL